MAGMAGALCATVDGMHATTQAARWRSAIGPEIVESMRADLRARGRERDARLIVLLAYAGCAPDRLSKRRPASARDDRVSGAQSAVRVLGAAVEGQELLSVRDGLQRDEAVIARAAGHARPSQCHGQRGTLTV